jgi:hypothetical protein
MTVIFMTSVEDVSVLVVELFYCTKVSFDKTVPLSVYTITVTVVL